MSNPSARNTRLICSWIGNVLLSAVSRFHAPGPRKAFLAVMLPGYGPQSEVPSGNPGTVLDVFAKRVAGGSLAMTYVLPPPPSAPLVDLNVWCEIGAEGV